MQTVKRSKLKWDSHARSPNSHFVQPIPTLRKAWLYQKSIKYPLRNSRIVRYNYGIGGQSRNSHNAQVQFRNCTDFHFALNIYIIQGKVKWIATCLPPSKSHWTVIKYIEGILVFLHQCLCFSEDQYKHHSGQS